MTIQLTVKKFFTSDTLDVSVCPSVSGTCADEDAVGTLGYLQVQAGNYHPTKLEEFPLEADDWREMTPEEIAAYIAEEAEEDTTTLAEFV